MTFLVFHNGSFSTGDVESSSLSLPLLHLGPATTSKSATTTATAACEVTATHQGAAAANWSSPSCHVKCPSYCCQAILIMEEAKARPMAIPKHIGQEDPSIMSFSPSKMTTQTLDHFSQSENEGVPLQTAWTFWLDKAVHNASLSEYKANIRKIYSVSTVQGFWSVFNHIPDVSELRLRSYYHLMRDEREPVWEDPALCHGGVWRIKCPKRDTVSLFILEEQI